MNSKQAIAKLGKVLGKRFAYRLDPKAQHEEARVLASHAADDLYKRQKGAAALRDARAAELLAGDAQYQSLNAHAAALQKEYEAQRSIAMRYPITVGVDIGLGLSVKAQGDNWQEVVDKVCSERCPA